MWSMLLWPNSSASLIQRSLTTLRGMCTWRILFQSYSSPNSSIVISTQYILTRLIQSWWATYFMTTILCQWLTSGLKWHLLYYKKQQLCRNLRAKVYIASAMVSQWSRIIPSVGSLRNQVPLCTSRLTHWPTLRFLQLNITCSTLTMPKQGLPYTLIMEIL